jgi:predicted lipoprotein with Yx(FWY)xxD motif
MGHAPTTLVPTALGVADESPVYPVTYRKLSSSGRRQRRGLHRAFARMTHTKPIALLAGAAVLLLAALAVATGGDNASAATTHPSAAAQRSTIQVHKTGLGRILVDSQGRTLYLFKKDHGTRSACFGECARAWPPLRATGKPTVGSGVNASMAGTTKRSDGKPQVTYNGHPLYLFKGDKKPGDTNGQGLNAFGAGWFVLSPAGHQISGHARSTSGGNGY